ncbi:hypothetical protein J6O86_08950 [bacterium]|nr:hypothetical protein [bacterium]
MNRKQVVRLTESDLHRIVKESVKKVLREVRDNTISDEEWDDINNAYNDSGLWRDSPSLDKKDDMDKMFSDVEDAYDADDKEWDEFMAYHPEQGISNPNIRDNSKRYHPYVNYLARNSERHTSPEQNGILRRTDFGKGINGSGDYLDIWK